MINQVEEDAKNDRRVSIIRENERRKVKHLTPINWMQFDSAEYGLAGVVPKRLKDNIKRDCAHCDNIGHCENTEGCGIERKVDK